MSTLAPGSQIEQTRTIQNKDKYKLSWSGFSQSQPNSERRRIISALLGTKTFGVAPIPVSKEMLEKFPKIDNFNVIGRCVVTGVAYARAYYDGTDNTGKIECGQPVVFDTVTGTSVTGINESWGPDEYSIIGTSLVDFEEEPPYEDYQNIIQVKLLQKNAEASSIYVLYSDYRIPGRFREHHTGRVVLGNAVADEVEIKDEYIAGYDVYGWIISITGITNGNPAVVTTIREHGLENGTKIYIDSVSGMTEINEQIYEIENATNYTFELKNIDSTTYTPYTTGGVVKFLFKTASRTSRKVEVVNFGRRDIRPKSYFFAVKKGSVAVVVSQVQE